jgi:hypothetical protein
MPNRNMRHFYGFVLLVCALLVAAPLLAQLPQRAPDIELTGMISGVDHQTYQDIPFDLPSGTSRIVVAFDHDMRDKKTVIDIGISDSHGFRGSSGSNKASFTISAHDATPSYLPGRVEPGRWALQLAIPNIRAGISANWRAKLWFLREGEALPAPVIDKGPGWYRGDLHLHSAHSDGSCQSQSGARVPCPLFKTLETAAARGLDFVALTEHNGVSQLNIYGVSEPINPRILPGGSISFATIADRVHALGGLVSINHPALPSGELCMGCGWAMPAADLRKADAVELVNGSAVATQGGTVDGPFDASAFWLKTLRETGALTAIGGSDNHDGTRADLGPGSVGRPTTVVYAEGLSQSAILAGIKRGRVFIDLSGVADNLLDLAVIVRSKITPMGGRLKRARGAAAKAVVHIKAPAGARLELWMGDFNHPVPLTGTSPYVIDLPLSPGRAVVRAVVRGSEGRVLMLSNAVVVDSE